MTGMWFYFISATPMSTNRRLSGLRYSRLRRDAVVLKSAKSLGYVPLGKQTEQFEMQKKRRYAK